MTARRTPRLAAAERACDLAWLHLVCAGLVSSHPEDLVTATLRTVLREAREAEDRARQRERRWAA